jgi:peptidoglycan/LPS O-acetylase OafA/YrhL
MTPKYRADIDGLRAVAVLSIVLFHLDIEPFTGGFVGVDIFFVISGFLITSIIVRELQAGEFSVARFYERRVRRILPALIVVLVASLLTGLLILTPQQFEELAGSAAATTVFSSNLFFYFGTGYFDGPSEYKPLLHTWSLAVEEQYYILFPFVLIVIARRLSFRFVPWLLAMTGLSFVVCVMATPSHEAAAFFLIPFRAWELLIGSLLAVKLAPPLTGRHARDLLAVSGLTMVMVSVLAYTPDTPFPGVAAALPTIGTAFIIHAGTSGGSFINRALGIRPLVFFGLISYSLYLWHWPVVVYAKTLLINEPNDIELGVMAVIILLLSTLSWRFVETPFRNRQLLAPRPRLFASFAAVSALLLAATLSVTVIDGFSTGLGPGTLSAESIGDPGWKHWKACEELGEQNPASPELCRFGDEDAPARYLFWGDSHALALATAANLSARREQASGWLAVRTGCPPLLSIERPGRQSCDEFNRAILEFAAAHTEVNTVILAARWAISANGTRYKNESGRLVTLVDLESGEVRDGAELLAIGLRRTVAALDALGKSIVLVTQVPEIGYDVPSANYTARLTGRDVNEMIAPSLAEFRDRTAMVDEAFSALAADFPLVVVDPSTQLCNGDYCQVVMDGTPLYRDDNHLSLRGCVFLSPLFDSVFARR